MKEDIACIIYVCILVIISIQSSGIKLFYIGNLFKKWR